MRTPIVGKIVLSLFVSGLAVSPQLVIADASKSGSKNTSKSIAKLERRVSNLEVTLSSSLRPREAKAASTSRAETTQQLTSWKGTIYNPGPTGVGEKTISVTFVATSETTGTWSSAPYNLVTPALAFWQEDQQGTFNGEYRIIQNSMFFYNVVGSGDTGTGSAGSVVVNVKDTTMLLSSFSSSLPSPLVELSLQP